MSKILMLIFAIRTYPHSVDAAGIRRVFVAGNKAALGLRQQNFH